jgi:chemotaxis protein methyltransferase CheR
MTLIKSELLQPVLEFIRKKTGIVLPESCYENVSTYVSEKLNCLSIDINQFLHLLASHKSEYITFINQVTINETYFFREEKQFKALEKQLLKKMMNKRSKLNFWSASCSSGEEPLSFYLLAHKVLGKDADIQITATDIDTDALGIFHKGTYTHNSFRTDGSAYHDLVRQAAVISHNTYTIDPDIIKSIKIFPYNVNSRSKTPFTDTFDIIFLRNTFIYFDFPIREKIINFIVSLLNDKGVLFFSATEIPLLSNKYLRLKEIDNIYYFEKNNTFDSPAEILETSPLLQQAIETRKIQPAATITPDMNKALHYAYKKIQNPAYSMENNNYQVSLVLLKIVYDINKGNFDLAVKNSEILKKKFRNNEIPLYLLAYIWYLKKDYEQAIRLFEKSISYCPGLWIARYYLGHSFIKQNNKKRALREWRVCIKHLQQYIDDNRYDYQLFLDGFNGKYFLNLCMKLIEEYME